MRLFIDELGLVPGRRGRALRDFISAGINAVGNIISGSNASNAATKAAKIQADAAAAAGQKLEDTTAAVNPGITATADTAATGVSTAADNAGAGAVTAANNASSFLNPYAAAGSTASEGLKAGVTAGGQFNSSPTLAQLQMDPGYAFRLQQGTLALDRSAAARGGAGGGGETKAITDFAQNDASQEYQNAFNRFETNRQNNYTELLGVSGQGETAATTQGGQQINASQYAGTTGLTGAQVAGGFTTGAADLTAANTIGAAKTAGDYATGGAAATAAGVVGAANAQNGAIAGVTNGITGALTLKKLLANPATPSYNLSPTDLGWSASEEP